jgi:hypothetical protein
MVDADRGGSGGHLGSATTRTLHEVDFCGFAFSGFYPTTLAALVLCGL